jgi:hypothetical protein
MTGVTAPCCHNPTVNHPRSTEGCRGLMARFAGRRGREVVCRFAHNPGVAAAMTGRAARHYSRVVVRSPRKRGRRFVTRFAGSGGREVVRRLTHDSSIAAAMTSRAAGRDPLVVHRRPRPKGCRRFMAGLAPQRGWNVRCRFAQGRRPVMASRTAGRDPRVIKRSPGKRRGGFVTALTGSAGCDVCRRFGPDSGEAAAMTGHAAGRDPLVVHRRSRPKGCRRFMAGLAS